MTGEPLTVAGTPFQPFDLWAPDKILTPAFAPQRPGQRNSTPPRYVPQPQPEGTVRVVLGDGYYEHEYWNDYRAANAEFPEAVFDIPVEQRDRWQVAMDAYSAMQHEIAALMEARRRAPGPIRRGAYIPQP